MLSLYRYWYCCGFLLLLLLLLWLLRCVLKGWRHEYHQSYYQREVRDEVPCLQLLLPRETEEGLDTVVCRCMWALRDVLACCPQVTGKVIDAGGNAIAVLGGHWDEYLECAPVLSTEGRNFITGQCKRLWQVELSPWVADTSCASQDKLLFKQLTVQFPHRLVAFSKGCVLFHGLFNHKSHREKWCKYLLYKLPLNPCNYKLYPNV